MLPGHDRFEPVDFTLNNNLQQILNQTQLLLDGQPDSLNMIAPKINSEIEKLKKQISGLLKLVNETNVQKGKSARTKQ